MKIILKIATLLLSFSLIIAAAFLAYVAIPYFGNKALIVRSGSMQPSIAVGDLVVVKGSEQITTPTPGVLPKYKVGEIVAFYSANNHKTIVTHRVADVKKENGKILYQTKGDANNTEDVNLVEENKILGKTMITLLSVGKIFALAKTKQGFYGLILAPAVLVILFEIVNIVSEIKKIRRKKTEEEFTNGKFQNNVLLRIIIPFILGTMFFNNSFASYADSETSSGNSLQAAEIFPSSQEVLSLSVSLPQNLGINEFSPHANSETNEWVEFYNPQNLNLSSYWLDDDTNFSDDANSSPKKSLSTINNQDPLHPYIEYTSSFLNNTGDFVVIFAPDGSIVDQFQYTLDPGVNISIGRSPDGTGSFQSCTVSTKGLTNGGC